MAAYQGAYFTATFTIKDGDGVVVDITGWEFESDIRDSRGTGELLSLTTANLGWVILDAVNGRLSMVITAAQTLALTPTGRMVFDCMRTDPAAGPVYLFGGSFLLKQPVTRAGTD